MAAAVPGSPLARLMTAGGRAHSASNLRRRKNKGRLGATLVRLGQENNVTLVFSGCVPTHVNCHNRPQQGNARQPEQSIGGCRTGAKSTDGYGGGACRERGIHGTVKFGSACQVNGFKPVIVDGWGTDGTVYPFIRRPCRRGPGWESFHYSVGYVRRWARQHDRG